MEGEIKRTSGLSEAVGYNEKEKNQLHADAEDVFNEQFFEEWEREITPEEREIIEGILSKLPEFVERYGGKPLPITEDHVHIVDEEKATEEIKKQFNDAGGKYSFVDQAVIIRMEPDLPHGKNKLNFAQKVLHEFLHFSSFQSYQKDNKYGAKERRCGFSVRMRGGTEFYFDNIEEALIQEATIMFDEEYFLGIPALFEELQKREAVREKIKAEGVLPADMVAMAGQNGEPIAYAYFAEIYKLRELIHNIYLANKDTVSSEKGVKDEFLRAVFSGRLLKVVKMVEKWGGKGAFRRLGAITKRDRGIKR